MASSLVLQGSEEQALGSEGMLERGPLLVELSGLLHEAGRAGGQLALVAGEAGIGKTTLVRHFGHMVERTTRVFVGACDPLSTPRPLAPLHDLAEPLRLSDLLHPGSYQPVELFGTLLDRLRGPRPVVIAFEDVHWADEATLDLLRFLGRRVTTTSALVIATYRDDEIGGGHPLRTVLGDLATAAGVTRLVLPPLSLRAVSMLAAGSALDAADLLQRTGGNPFFVTEVLAGGAGTMPATIPDAVLARVARLPAASRAALELAAVAGPEVEPWLLEAAGCVAAGDVDGCVVAGMLRGDGGRYTFRHELAREVVYAAILPQHRRELHRAVLTALSSKPQAWSDHARLAHHAEAAGDAEATLRHASAAAQWAASIGAHREAAAQYDRALRFAGALPAAEQAGLWEAFAEESATTDRYGVAIAAREEADTLWRAIGDLARQGQNLAWLARHLVADGRNVEAEEASRASIALLEQLPASRELGRAYGVQAGLRMLNRDNEEALVWAKRAHELAFQFNDTGTIITGHDRIGSALLLMDDDRGLEHLERAVELAREAGLHANAGWAWGNLGSGSGEMFNFARALPYFEAGIAYCREHEADAPRFYMTAWLAVCYGYLGRFDEAETAATEVLARPGTTAISRITALIALGRVRVRRGDADAAGPLDEALDLALPTGTLQRLAPVRSVRAEAAWLAGDLARTRAEVREVLDLALHHKHPWHSGDLILWLRRAAETVAPPPFVAQPYALLFEGRRHEAAQEWRRRGCPYEAALAFADSGDPDELREAVATLQGLGARPAARMLASRLRQQGVPGVPRGPRQSTRQHAARLTPRQDEVLRLLAEGLQNPEIAARLFVSTKTVDNHVAAVLRKLDVSTRSAAVAEARRRGLL